MRSIFMGSGDFSRDLLKLLLEKGFEFAAVVTRPDQPAGRGLRQRATPVKATALEKGLVVLQPEDLSHEDDIKILRSLQPDFILVADYGNILPGEVLEIPGKGCVNVHPSLLPSYRGAAPIQRTLMDGAAVTGVTLILMDHGVDTGPIISRAEMEIAAEDNFVSLRERLAGLAADMVVHTLPRYAGGEIPPIPQDSGLATYAGPIEKSELAMDWSMNAKKIHDRVRALSPSPGAFSRFRGKRIKILSSRFHESPYSSEPGRIVVVDDKNLLVAAGRGSLSIQVLQPEGKNVMSIAEFIRGYRPQVGECFQEPEI